MDDMVKQVLAGWARAAVAAVSGGVGWEAFADGEIGKAVVALLVALAMGGWSMLQKRGVTKA